MTRSPWRWRSYLIHCTDDARDAERTTMLLAALGAPTTAPISEAAATLPAPGRLSGLRGPIRWLAWPPPQQTADGRIVARVARRSWGRDGVWVGYPVCPVGLGYWVPEEWLPGVGWIRVPAGAPSWPRKIHPARPGARPGWRPCGAEDLLSPALATRHIRAALVRWRTSAVEVQAAGISASDLAPLLSCVDAGVREGALEASAWAAPAPSHAALRHPALGGAR